MSSNLKVKLELTHYVDFLTYAHVSKEGMVGLDEFIADCYGLDNPMEMGGNNDTDYSVNVEPKKSEFDWDKDQLADIKRCSFMEDHHLRLVLCDLCADGYLSEGKYVVRMSW